MQNLLSRITKYSIYILVFLLPIFFLPFSFEVFEYSKQYLLFFLVSLAFFSWILRQIIYDKEIRIKKSPIDYFILGFLSISIISAIFSVDKNSSIFGFYGRFSNGIIGLLSFGILYFLITNMVEGRAPNKEDQKIKNKNHAVGRSFGLIIADKIINLFLWSSFTAVLTSYLSVFGVWQKLGFFLPQVMLQRTFNLVSGSLEGLAIFLAVIVIFLSGLLLGKAKSIFYWALLLASLGLLIIVDFTPAWIILLAILILFTGVSLAKRIFKEDVNRLLVPIFLIIISLAMIIWQPLKINLPREQVLPQLISWQVSFQSATDNIKNIFLGSGIGTFHYDFAKYKPQSFNQIWMWQIRFDRAGSHIAELLGNSGFLGVLIYLGLAGFILTISWFSVDRNFTGLSLRMALAALIAGQFVYYQNTSLAFAFWMILGLSAVSQQSKSTTLIKEKIISFKNSPELSLLFLTLVIIFGVAISALYFYGARHYLADVNYSKSLAQLGELRIASLEKAANLNPQFSQYRAALARAYFSEVSAEMAKPAAGQNSSKIKLLVSRAIDQARTATLLGPNQVANWESLGLIYRDIGGVAQGAAEWGIKSFEKAIELDPTSPALYTELGKLYLALGDKEKAKSNFNEAVVKKSDYAAATIQLALLLEQENILDEAVAKLESLVINNPFDAEARFQLGRLYFNKNRTDEAIEQFASVVILLPNHSNAHYSLGIAYAFQGKKQLAIEEFEKVLELNPDNTDVLKKLKDLRGN